MQFFIRRKIRPISKKIKSISQFISYNLRAIAGERQRRVITARVPSFLILSLLLPTAHKKHPSSRQFPSRSRTVSAPSTASNLIPENRARAYIILPSLAQSPRLNSKRLINKILALHHSAPLIVSLSPSAGYFQSHNRCNWRAPSVLAAKALLQATPPPPPPALLPLFLSRACSAVV